MGAFSPDPPPKLGLQLVGFEIWDNGVRIGEIERFASASLPDIAKAFEFVNRGTDGEATQVTHQEPAA